MQNAIKLLFLVTLVACSSSIAAQNKVTLYYNEKWELTSPEKAVVRREASIDLKEMTCSGIYEDFNSKGTMIGTSIRDKESQAVLERNFRDDGSIRSEVKYSNGRFIINELLESNGEKIIVKGTGKFSLPYTYIVYLNGIKDIFSGKVNGEFERYQRKGIWKYFDNNGAQECEEEYKKGILIKRTDFLQFGSKYTGSKEVKQININESKTSTDEFDFDPGKYATLQNFFLANKPQGIDSISRLPAFAGGQRLLTSSIQKGLRYPQESRRAGVQGTVVVTVTIGENGVVQNYDAIKSVNQECDAESLRILKSLELKWLPACLNGKYYQAKASVPIAFHLPKVR